MSYRITIAMSPAPETWQYAVVASSRESCVDGIAAAKEQVARAGGAAIFSDPREMSFGGRWSADGTVILRSQEAA